MERTTTKTIEPPTIDWIRGNAVISWMAVEDADWDNEGMHAVSNAYRRAVNKAKAFGGRKFHNKSYGGGIAFNSEQAVMRFFNACHEQE